MLTVIPVTSTILSLEAIFVHNVVLFVRELASFAILNRKYIPPTTVRHCALRGFYQRPVSMHATTMLPAIGPCSFKVSIGIGRWRRRWWRGRSSAC